jgi:hypothetical protein
LRRKEGIGLNGPGKLAKIEEGKTKPTNSLPPSVKRWWLARFVRLLVQLGLLDGWW